MAEGELKKKYRLHRMRIEKATSLVDSLPPKRIPRPTNEKELSFLGMMRALYSNGDERTFTKSPLTPAKSKWYNLKESINVGNLISNEITRSELSLTQKSPEKENGKSNTKRSVGVPLHVMQRYGHLNFIHTPELWKKLLRPKIFMELHTKTGQPLGRMTIQLYTEACPEVVLQFVRVCMQGQNEKMNITRILAPMWLEGGLQVDDRKALTGANVEHDPLAINHGCGSGILSFPSRYLRGSKFRLISFTISFKPMNGLNGKRIAFGKIQRGFRALDAVQNFKTTNSGRPIQDIIVSSCGVL